MILILFLFLFGTEIQRKPSIEVSSAKRKAKTEALAAVNNQKTVGEVKVTLDHDPEGHTLKIIVFGAKGYFFKNLIYLFFCLLFFSLL